MRLKYVKDIYNHKKILTVLFALVFLVSLAVGLQPAYANGNVQPLVDTQWLADNLNKKDLKIVHVASMGGKKEHFDMKHVPGSVYLGIGELMGDLGGGSTPPDKAKFEALMGSFGINNDSHVIILGGSGDNVFIYGAFWLMKYHGHEKVSLLDGGVRKWMKEGRKTSGKPTPIKNTKYSASPDSSVFATADDVLKGMNNAKAAIVDVRGTDEYIGTNVMGNKRTGHVPGAVHMEFYSSNMTQNGTFKSLKDLQALYDAKGVTKDKEVISYCQAGVRAANTHFVLQYLLGYPNVKNYVGSWGEWSSRLDPSKYPVEK
jgi:thiosulfate/3-mercaptopyruvate sulfurtransferase